MQARSATRAIRESRACTLILPSFNLLMLSYLDFRLWVRLSWHRYLKTHLKWEIQERKKWKLKLINWNRIRCYQAANILPNSITFGCPLTSSCHVAGVTVPHLYMTSFKCCRSFTLAGIPLMSTAMKLPEKKKKKSLGTVFSPILQPILKFTLSEGF